MVQRYLPAMALRAATILTVFGAACFAAQPLICTLSAVPPIVRAEGVAEEAGQLTIACTGGTPTPAGEPLPKANFTLFPTAPFTSRTPPNGSEQFLMIDDPLPSERIVATTAPFTGTVTASGTGAYKDGSRPTVFPAAGQGVFTGIPFDPPGNGARVLRFVNLRVDASQVPPGTLANPGKVTVSVSVGGSANINITTTPATLAYVQPSFSTAITPVTFNQCTGGARTFKVKFSELLPNAFRHVQPATVSQNVIGTLYGTESMFYDTAFAGTLAAGSGLATQGTRLAVSFNGVPANVSLSVATTATNASGDTAALTTAAGSTTDAAGKVTLTGGSGVAMWELTASNANAVSSLEFTVTVDTKDNPLAGLGAATATAYLAPVATGLVSPPPVPRFIQSATPAIAFTVVACPVNITLDRTSVPLAARIANPVVPGVGTVKVTLDRADVNWQATSNQNWLTLSRATGTSALPLLFTANTAGLTAGRYQGVITVTAPGAVEDKTINVTLNVYDKSGAPFGSFDTPVNNATGLAGSVPITGWALDDYQLSGVSIWRDPVGTEPRHTNGLVFIGDGTFVQGARPDVAGAHPWIPVNDRAGWGYLLLTNFLPAVSGPSGNGTYVFHAIATDSEGNSTLLGSKTITVDNKNATKPFGTLDTPGPGATISGAASVSFGWALTPNPAAIPTDGSTIWVGVDGVLLGHPLYNLYRSDIANAFPGYANSGGAVGAYYLDTTKFADGIHTIGWLVYDGMNRGDGVGSRFFTTSNGIPAKAQVGEAAADLLLDAMRAARQRRPDPPAELSYRAGFQPDAPLQPVVRGGGDLIEPVPLFELDRVELHLPTGSWTIDESSKPAGSTFDPEGGIFYWQIGPAFLGEFSVTFTNGGDKLIVPFRIQPGTR